MSAGLANAWSADTEVLCSAWTEARGSIDDDMLTRVSKLVKWDSLIANFNIEVVPIDAEQYPEFVDKLLAAHPGSDDSTRGKLLANPQSLSEVIPGVKLAECENTHLVYEMKSVPIGMATDAMITSGNISKISLLKSSIDLERSFRKIDSLREQIRLLFKESEIKAEGAAKSYSRSKIGESIEIAPLGEQP